MSSGKTRVGRIIALAVTGLVMLALPATSSAYQQVTVTPGSLDFGIAKYGHSTAPQTLEVKSTGDDPFTVRSLKFFFDGGFFVKSQTCKGVSIPPGQSCTLSIAFSAGQTGRSNGSLEIRDTDTYELVELTGFGIDPELSVDPFVQDFGNVTIGDGQPRPAQDFTVFSSGETTVTVDSIRIAGDDAADFKLTESDKCLRALAPAGQCSFTVSFDPAGSSRHREATLVIGSDDGDSPNKVDLEGTVSGPDGSARRAISLNLRSKRKVVAGETLLVRAKVRNTSRKTIKSVRLKTRVRSGLATKPGTIRIRKLAPGKTVTRKIRIRIRQSAGKGRKLKINVVASGRHVSSRLETRTVTIG